jgi:hypothetical protein
LHDTSAEHTIQYAGFYAVTYSDTSPIVSGHSSRAIRDCTASSQWVW